MLRRIDTPPWRATSPGDFSMPTDADAVFFANASNGASFGGLQEFKDIFGIISTTTNDIFTNIGKLPVAGNVPTASDAVLTPPPPPPPPPPPEKPWYKQSSVMLPVGVGALVLAAGATVYNARAQGGRAYGGMRAFGGNRSDFGPMNPSDPTLSTDGLDCGCDV